MLRTAAYGVALSHLAIAVVGLIVIQPGSDGAADLATRMAYVAEHRQVWLAAWLVPPVAAALLLWMAVELRARLAGDRAHPGLQLAVVATASGLAIEGVACCLAAGALPVLGAAGDGAAFVAVERVVQLGTAVFGNLPFTLGALLMTRALAGAGASRLVVGLGYADVAAGVAFMAAGAAGEPALIGASNGALFVALAAFSIALARSPFSRPV